MVRATTSYLANSSVTNVDAPLETSNIGFASDVYVITSAQLVAEETLKAQYTIIMFFVKLHYYIAISTYLSSNDKKIY